MMVVKKAKEELQSQEKGFLKYANEMGIIAKGDKTEIAKVLGLEESDKNGFIKRLSKNFGKKNDLSNKEEIEKILKKKNINFDEIWEKYTKYLYVKKFFEPYENFNQKLNNSVIEYILNSKNLDSEKLKIFLASDMYKEWTKECDIYLLLDTLFEISNGLELKQFKFLVNICPFKIFKRSWSDYDFIHLLKRISKYDEIFRNIDLKDIILKQGEHSNNWQDHCGRFWYNVRIYEKNLFLKDFIKDYRMEWFYDDFQEIINSEKKFILNQNNIRTDFYYNGEDNEDEQKKYLESIFNGYTFDLTDKEKLKDLFKLREAKIEPTIIDRLMLYNESKRNPLFPEFESDEEKEPIRLFKCDDMSSDEKIYHDRFIKDLIGERYLPLSEEQKEFLESIFDGYTFDLSSDNEKILLELFKPPFVAKKSDIISRLENFNIIKAEIPNISNDVFEKYGIYSHLENVNNPKMLLDYIRTLKKMGFDKKDDLINMLIFSSNDRYHSDGNCYFNDVLEITKLYMDTLNLSATEILDIYKTLFYRNNSYRNFFMPIFDNDNNKYMKFYKDKNNIIALKNLGLSNKAIISCQFTPIKIFEVLQDLGMGIDDINKIFTNDHCYHDADPVNSNPDFPKFERSIQSLLMSNFHGNGYGWKNRESQRDEKALFLNNLLSPSKKHFIIPFLKVFGDNFGLPIGIGWWGDEKNIKKLFEKIDVIIDCIDPDVLMQFLESTSRTECFYFGDIDNLLENMKIVSLNVKNFDGNSLNNLKGVLKYSQPQNLQLIFEKFEVDLRMLVGSEGLSKLVRYGNSENLIMILNKFEIDLKTLINSEGLYKVLVDAIPNNLETVFLKKPDISIDEIIKLKDSLGLRVFGKNFETLIGHFGNLDFDDFITLLSFDGSFPEKLDFKEENKIGYLKFLNEIVETDYNSVKKSMMIEKVVTFTFEQAENYVEVFKMLDDSISMDIQRIKNELIDQLLESDNPKDVAKKIINIFERNNLPLTGKIFKVFEFLYPKEKFKNTLQSHGSPLLHKYFDEGKNFYDLIYRDLMNIAIKSGDRSLREYINTFVGSEELLRNFEKIISDEGFDSNDPLCLEKKLEEDDQAKLLYLFRKISVLYNRYFGKEINEGNTIEDKKYGESTVADNLLVEFYNDIKKGFHLRKRESIYDRLQRFLLGLGYHSFNEVLKDMEKSKKQAHERGLNLYNEAVDNGGKIKFPRGAFLKGVDEDAFSKIINRGVTCREYLGGGDDGKAAGSDCTPFDIDGLYLDSQTNWTGYGNILLITDTNRCNIVDTRNNGLELYKETQYELFKTGVVSTNHYGIRTGIPTTEVDYVIYNGSFDRFVKIKNSEGDDIYVFSIFQNMCYEIARNGYYIPIVDNEGNVRFTPEMYHQIRAGFNYMQYYDGFDVECVDGKWISSENDNELNKGTGTNKKITEEGLGKLISDNSPNNEKYSGFAKENRELAENTITWIKEILEKQCGIKFNSKHDSSITGAELHDSGSTGRGTDIPTKDVDLDFTLLLDAKDYNEKFELIKETIYRETGTGPEDRGGGSRKGGFQMKSKKNKIGQSSERPDGIPLDLLILKKSQVIDYSSSDAMKEKLKFIKDMYGEDDLDWVRTNIIIMKKLLKSQSCYKKSQAEGGIAGIGVENWISQHHGSFIEALESFEKVAFNGEYKDGADPVPLEKFKLLYPIYDAGENYKDGCNDNFVEKINEHGYNGMLNIVIALRTKGIEGIEELIKKYEKDKAEHIN